MASADHQLSTCAHRSSRNRSSTTPSGYVLAKSSEGLTKGRPYPTASRGSRRSSPLSGCAPAMSCGGFGEGLPSPCRIQAIAEKFTVGGPCRRPEPKRDACRRTPLAPPLPTAARRTKGGPRTSARGRWADPRGRLRCCGKRRAAVGPPFRVPRPVAANGVVGASRFGYARCWSARPRSWLQASSHGRSLWATTEARLGPRRARPAMGAERGVPRGHPRAPPTKPRRAHSSSDRARPRAQSGAPGAAKTTVPAGATAEQAAAVDNPVHSRTAWPFWAAPRARTKDCPGVGAGHSLPLPTSPGYTILGVYSGCGSQHLGA